MLSFWPTTQPEKKITLARTGSFPVGAEQVRSPICKVARCHLSIGILWQHYTCFARIHNSAYSAVCRNYHRVAVSDPTQHLTM